MRGGRGRGGFSAVSFKKTPFKPIDTYPYNPNCEDTPVLTETEKEVVVFNRLLKRFANSSEDYVVQSRPRKIIDSYEDQFTVQSQDAERQRQLLVQPIGPEYFPDELLGKALCPNSQKIGRSKTVDWAKFQGSESAAAAGTGEGGESGEGSESAAEEDYGGEDYGHDHFADEDVEDEFQDGFDGGDD